MFLTITETVNTWAVDISTWLGASVSLTTALMGAVATAIVVFGGMAINKQVKRSKRGYYR